MKIAVLIKQVPDTAAVRFDEETGTVLRQEADAIVNPLDLAAVELALQWSRRQGGTTLALSMGPTGAESAVREVLALGIDAGFLISDRAFAGSDTFATASILAEAIRRVAPDLDLLLCGQRATDGDTSQVGPEVAALLNLPVVTCVSGLLACADGRIQVRRLIEGGQEELTLALPAVLTINKSAADPRLPTLAGKRRARTPLRVPDPAADSLLPPDDEFFGSLTRLSNDHLRIPESRRGLTGSPTRIIRVFHPPWSRQGERHTVKDGESAAAVADDLHLFLQKKGILNS